MNDFQLLKAVLEKAECDSDIYFDGDESCIEIPGGVTIYFHPSGDIDGIATHADMLYEED